MAFIFLKIEIVLFLSDMKVNTTSHSILWNNHWRHFGSSLSRPYTVNTVIKHVRWTRLPHHVFPGGLHSLCREVVGNLTTVSLLQMSLLDVPLPSWATTSAHVAVWESGLWSPPAGAWEEVLGRASFPLGPWPFPPPPEQHARPQGAGNYKKELQWLAHQCSRQHYSEQPRGGNSPGVLQGMNGETECGLTLQWNIIEP